MKALTAYVEEKNRWGAIFGSEPLSLDNPQDRQKIADSIDAELSPENLSCDGELSMSQINARYRRLVTVAEQLKRLDSSVKFYEY